MQIRLFNNYIASNIISLVFFMVFHDIQYLLNPLFQITNQMIETCKQYVTCRGKETIWTQDRQLVRQKLTSCITLNHVYRDTYFVVKAQPFLPGQVKFIRYRHNIIFLHWNFIIFVCNRLLLHFPKITFSVNSIHFAED